MPVHNEELFLPYSLPSLKELNCKVVIVLDRCSDSSEYIIKHYLSNAIVHVKQQFDRRFSMSESKNIGCKIARQNGAKTILISDADIVLDVEAVKKALSLVSSSFVVLAYKQYSLFGSAFSHIVDELHNFYCIVVRKFKIHPVRTGIFVGLADRMFFEDEDEEYDYLQQKHKTVWIKTNSLHLRPRWNSQEQVRRGLRRANLPQYNLFKVILSSFFVLQPLIVAGYLKEKMYS